jgi:energy-coupling factor transporter ATP-binding protein EcfA2
VVYRIPAIVVFGNTGSGKSTLSNTLVGIENAFQESEDVESETMETKGKNGIFDNQPTFVIDTPGIHDASGLDTPHLVAMTQYIKEHKEVKAFVIVINFLNIKLDDGVKRLFQLVNNMYPGKRWYHNLAVVWSFYYKNLTPQQKKQEPKREGFKRFIRKYIVPNISDDELNSIPQYFVDSVEAREENYNRSREELKHLIAWVSQLHTLQENLGEIQEVNAEIKSQEEEFKTDIISETTKLNIKTIITAKFKRIKSILYNGEITYSDWEEIPNSRNEEKQILPIEPIGKPTIEKRTREDRTEPVKIVTGQRKVGHASLFIHRPKVDVGYFEQTIYYINEERICQPMNDGSIKYEEWKEKSRKEKRKRWDF